MRKYATNHCQQHDFVFKAKNSVGTWLDCQRCGTTSLVLTETTQVVDNTEDTKDLENDDRQA